MRISDRTSTPCFLIASIRCAVSIHVSISNRHKGLSLYMPHNFRVLVAVPSSSANEMALVRVCSRWYLLASGLAVMLSRFPSKHSVGYMHVSWYDDLVSNLLICSTRWREPRSRPDTRAVDVEEHRSGQEYHHDEAEYRGCPRHAKVVEHRRCKEREHSACYRADELDVVSMKCRESAAGGSKYATHRIDGNGAIGVEPVTVNDIAHPFPESDEATKTQKRRGDDLWHPRDRWE